MKHKSVILAGEACALALSMVFAQSTNAEEVTFVPYTGADALVEQSYTDTQTMVASTRTSTAELFNKLQTEHGTLIASLAVFPSAPATIFSDPLKTTAELMKQKYPEKDFYCSATMHHHAPEKSDFLDNSCKLQETSEQTFEYDISKGKLTACVAETKMYNLGKIESTTYQNKTVRWKPSHLALTVRSCQSKNGDTSTKEQTYVSGKIIPKEMIKNSDTDEAPLQLVLLPQLKSPSGQTRYYAKDNDDGKGIVVDPQIKIDIRRVAP